MTFHHMRRWALALIALALITFSVAACSNPYSSPGGPNNGTPAPTSPSGY